MSPLPRSTPAAAGVDARGVLSFLDAAADARMELHGLTVVRGGRQIADAAWAPYATNGLNLLYSVSKSFTSAALGAAMLEGVIGLDERVLDRVADVTPTDARIADVTVRQVAAMTTGRDDDGFDSLFGMLDGGVPLMQAWFSVHGSRDPGTAFSYDNTATLALGGLLRAVTGRTLVDQLTASVLRPLGIERLAWRTLDSEAEEGFSGLHLRTSDIAAFGQLMLQRGVWHGRRLLSEAWVDAATSVQVPTPGAGGADWCQGYGLQFWRSRHGYRADGAFGQYVLVLPEHDAVVALTAELVAQGQDLLDLVWEHLLPAFGGEPDSASDAVLAERLAGLRIPALADSAPASSSTTATAIPVDDAPPIVRAAVGQGRRDRMLTVTFADGQEATMPVGDGEWLPGSLEVAGADPLPVSSSGGWRGDDAFEAELRFTSTPHSVRLRLADGRLDADWRVVPLYGQDPRTLAVRELTVPAS